jgi:hypothetical protein
VRSSKKRNLLQQYTASAEHEFDGAYLTPAGLGLFLHEERLNPEIEKVYLNIIVAIIYVSFILT